MPLALAISPHGRLHLVDEPDEAMPSLPAATEQRIRRAFDVGAAAGMEHLATVELRTALPASLMFARDFAQRYLIRLSRTPDIEELAEVPAIPPPVDELAPLPAQAPPMKGLEYLNAALLGDWWKDLDVHVREAAGQADGGIGAYLRTKNPLLRLLGRVTFHLAENKRDPQRPFAFMATWSNRLSAMGTVQHLPLSRALAEYAGAKNKEALLSLLTPIHRAAEQVAWVKAMVESGEVFHAMAWTPKQAYQFLRDLPAMEASGLIVRVPDWWKAKNASRPQVSVKIGDAAKSKLGADALLDFSVGVTFDGQQIDPRELEELLASADGLVRLHGQWVEVDRDRLRDALDHWKQVELEVRTGGGISFAEGMRLLAGAGIEQKSDDGAAEQVRQWTGIAAGEWLGQTLSELRDPDATGASPPGLKATLRPYQHAGVNWLRFMTRLRLGACLADDMGLGKTIQVLGLLLHAKKAENAASERHPPSLLVVPASLIANWKSEIVRFAPSLSVRVVHPSEARGKTTSGGDGVEDPACDLVITTYGMLLRDASLRERRWALAILDEAQAIKNTGSRQTKAVKQLQSAGRIALTGTPIENRLSDLWSLFDFLNPGLLGSAKAFSRYVKSISQGENHSYAPLRALVSPYILRRLKTDKRIIADLPDKTEVKAYCGLSKQQAVLYEQSVRELADALDNSDGIKRRGVVLAFLMRFKQICNHPAQWSGQGGYDPSHSGKFQRLADICQELAARQERALVFTQFREITGPLAEFLQAQFGRPGLVLHGGTPVGRRREMVETFQNDDGPPFFVLSLKAGGTGLNLTGASQVIHFDRWWNPAVEEQATDRAFRIGQKRNVLVHKFVCRGTVEEKIDQLITDKRGLSKELLEGGAEQMLTEMTDKELLNFVALDISKSIEE